MSILSVEITTDPLGRGYNEAGSENAGPGAMTDAQVATSLNAVNRPVVVTIDEVLKFLLLDNTYNSDTGNDTQDRAIWERMQDVAALYDPDQSAALSNPWGATIGGVPNITEIRVIKTKQLVDFVTLSAQGSLPFDITDSNFQVYLAGAQQAGCMSTAQETALLALGDDLQTRSKEIGWADTTREEEVADVRGA